jgi:stress response protein YsnF
MNCYNISSVADMTKKPTERKISETKKKSKKTKTNNDNDNNENNNPRQLSTKEEKAIQIANIIPVLEERFSVSKKTLIEHAKIEKRWITKTKKIEVPVSSEEVYINDKLMKSYQKDDQEEDVLSEVNKQIVQSFEDIDNDSSKKEQYSILESNESKRELIPLFDDIDNESTDNSTKNDVNTNKETKKIIPILGEQIVVSKRIVQIGELIITKNKVIENKKIAVDTISEKATIRYPDGNTKILE